MAKTYDEYVNEEEAKRLKNLESDPNYIKDEDIIGLDNDETPLSDLQNYENEVQDTFEPKKEDTTFNTGDYPATVANTTPDKYYENNKQINDQIKQNAIDEIDELNKEFGPEQAVVEPPPIVQEAPVQQAQPTQAATIPVPQRPIPSGRAEDIMRSINDRDLFSLDYYKQMLNKGNTRNLIADLNDAGSVVAAGYNVNPAILNQMEIANRNYRSNINRDAEKYLDRVENANKDPNSAQSVMLRKFLKDSFGLDVDPNFDANTIKSDIMKPLLTYQANKLKQESIDQRADKKQEFTEKQTDKKLKAAMDRTKIHASIGTDRNKFLEIRTNLQLDKNQQELANNHAKELNKPFTSGGTGDLGNAARSVGAVRAARSAIDHILKERGGKVPSQVLDLITDEAVTAVIGRQPSLSLFNKMKNDSIAARVAKIKSMIVSEPQSADVRAFLKELQFVLGSVENEKQLLLDEYAYSTMSSKFKNAKTDEEADIYLANLATNPKYTNMAYMQAKALWDITKLRREGKHKEADEKQKKLDTITQKRKEGKL